MPDNILYIVSETSCLREGSGAFRHIEVGKKELGKKFEVDFLPLCPLPDTVEGNTSETHHAPSHIPAYKKTALWGTIRDFFTLLRNHLGFFHWLKTVRTKKPLALYERASYLNFNGLIIAKILGIPHVYEANGLQYLVARTYYRSGFNFLAKNLEKLAYRMSSYTYFIGSWGDALNLNFSHWENIENGIEASFLDTFKDISREVSEKVNICFIGSLMPHHRMDILLEAIQKLSGKEKVEVHLIGNKFGEMDKETGKWASVKNHGFLSREQLPEVLAKMHIGVIPGGFEYPSFMKLFEYGAAKMLIIAPDLYNLKKWFSDDEILFFDKNNPDDFAAKIDWVLTNPENISRYGENIFSCISEKHTWEKIFSHKSRKIQSLISEYSSSK